MPYVPNRPPVPLITHQGELNVSGGVHFPLSPGYDYEIVYAPWDHYSLFGAFQFDRGWESDGLVGPDTSNYNNRFYEIGFGYFDSPKIAEYELHYEAYLQIGMGTGANHEYLKIWPGYTASTDTTFLSVFRIGVQQNIGIEGSFGALGVGLGVGYEHFYSLNRTATDYNWPLSDSLTSSPTVIESSPHSTLYAQPVLFWRFGYKNVKIMQEFWFTLNTSPYSLFRGGNESLTLSLDF